MHVPRTLLRFATAVLTFLAVLTVVSVAAGQTAPAAAAPPATQSFALTDTGDLEEAGMHATPAEYQGRKAVRLSSDSLDSAGFGLVKGTNFRDGSIDVDVAVVPRPTPGNTSPGFIGVAFRIGQDAAHYEGVYIRPGNSVAPDQARRNHAIQYVSEPNFGWEKLRRTWPSIYESWVDLTPLAWTHLRIEVHGRKAQVFINGSTKPSLLVDGLKGQDLQGPIALWSFSGEQSYFANLKIENATPEPIQNGGEVAGTWDVQFMTDAGGFPGTLKLVRQDGSVSGFYSGPLGPNQAVWGTWRDGYVELSFGGLWPDQPGTVTATLAGWVDGDSAGGRARVEGRADGRWMATRQK